LKLPSPYRFNLTEISEERNKVDRDIFNTTQRVYLAGIELASLRDEAERLKDKADSLQANATQLQEGNVEGALEITRNADKRSKAALNKVKATEAVLFASARQRKRTEQRLQKGQETMTASQDENDKAIERIDRKLTEIEKEIPDINDAVCDRRGDPCDDLCGGGGCSNGCGGLSCKEGSVELAQSALRLAHDAEQLLAARQAANEEQLRKVSGPLSSSPDYQTQIQCSRILQKRNGGLVAPLCFNLFTDEAVKSTFYNPSYILSTHQYPRFFLLLNILVYILVVSTLNPFVYIINDIS
jgi:coxsackievirus/adenovirus receptor